VEEGGMARSEWRRVKWSGAERNGVESGRLGVELKGLEWRVARSEWRRVEWGEGDTTGVESGQVGVEESAMEWSWQDWSGEWP
jgi:hypothetical protein